MIAVGNTSISSRLIRQAGTGGLILILNLPFVSASSAWRPFSPASPWNQPIRAQAPADPDSAKLIEDLASRGPFQVNIKDWSIPVYYVDADQTPRWNVGDSRTGVYGAGFAFPRRIPIPDGAVASPPHIGESDRHLCIVDVKRQLEWGMWDARQDETGRWITGLGAVTDLSGSGVAPPWYESPREFDSHRARASGFPLIAGLIRVEEIRAGRIEHALVFAYDHCRGELFVPPASTAQATKADTTNQRGIPMGGQIQLDPAWDVEKSDLSAAGKIIARALQEYGAFCGDYAGANVLYAENSPAAVEAWSDILRSDELKRVFTPEMIRKHFRVLPLGNLLPGQNLTVPPPYVTAFAIEGEIAPAQIDQLTRTITIFPARTPENSRVKFDCTAYPRNTRAALDGHPVSVTEPVINRTLTSFLRLTAPDGSTDDWTVRPSVRLESKR